MPILEMEGVPSGERKERLFGIFYPNGVFFEKTEELGFSYILDHLLYEVLKNEIEDAGLGRVSGWTNYGYSEVILACEREKEYEVRRRMHQILYEDDWYDQEILRWIQIRREAARKSFYSIDQRYYERRLPGNPLCRSISAGIHCEPSRGNLNMWRRKYITCQNVTYCSLEEVGKAPEIEGKTILANGCLPCFIPQKIMPPKCIPWKRSNMVYAIPFDFSACNMLAAEACCQLMRKKFRSYVNDMGGKLCSASMYPDFIPEFRVHLQLSRGAEHDAAQVFEQFVFNQDMLNPEKVEKLCQALYASYRKKSTDPVAWLRFSGYNLMSGNRYNIEGLLNPDTYREYVTTDSIWGVVEMIRQKDHRTIFLTAAR